MHKTASGRFILETKNIDGVTYQLEGRRCSKEGCRCAKGKLHGPYWCAYKKKAGKLTSKHIGKELPQPRAKPKLTPPTQEQREAARERYRSIAYAILREAGVVEIELFKASGRSYANAKKRMVKIEDPTTKVRVFHAAHEAGHVALGHTCRVQKLMSAWPRRKY